MTRSRRPNKLSKPCQATHLRRSVRLLWDIRLADGWLLFRLYAGTPPAGLRASARWQSYDPAVTHLAVSDPGWTAIGTLALAVATVVAIIVTLAIAVTDRRRADAQEPSGAHARTTRPGR